MRQIAALVIVSALSSAGCAVVMTPPTLNHRAAWRWDNVISLPSGTLVRVSTVNGNSHEGAFIDADAASVSVQSQHGLIASPMAVVRRVERLGALTKSRTRRALTSATLGTAALALGVALGCLALGAQPCATSPKSLAVSAALFGATGAIFDDRDRMTIYLRP